MKALRVSVFMTIIQKIYLKLVFAKFLLFLDSNQTISSVSGIEREIMGRLKLFLFSLTFFLNIILPSNLDLLNLDMRRFNIQCSLNKIIQRNEYDSKFKDNFNEETENSKHRKLNSVASTPTSPSKEESPSISIFVIT